MAVRRKERVLGVIGTVISIGLGVMLLVAALLKAADPHLFIDEIRGYQVFPSLAPLAAYAFLLVEILIALVMILHVMPRFALAAFMALMLFFIGITAWAWAHGHTGGCGCFGRLASRPPWEVMIEDGIYVVLAGFSFWAVPAWIRSSRTRWVACAVALPVFLTGPWLLPRAPVDSFITGLKPGSNLQNLAADDLKQPLTEGKVFMAFLGDECPACIQSLPVLEQLAATEGAPRVNGIFAGDRKEKRAWALEHVPSFALAHASKKSLHQYYRRLPVFILMEDGRVQKIWWDRAPTPEQVLVAAG